MYTGDGWSRIVGKFLAENSHLLDLKIRLEGGTTLLALRNIFESLESNTTLEALSIQYQNRARDDPETFANMSWNYAAGLGKSVSLRSLILEGVKLRGRIQPLADALRQNKSLRRVDIIDETLTNEDLGQVHDCLISSTIEELNLSPKLTYLSRYHRLMSAVADRKNKAYTPDQSHKWTSADIEGFSAVRCDLEEVQQDDDEWRDVRSYDDELVQDDDSIEVTTDRDELIEELTQHIEALATEESSRTHQIKQLADQINFLRSEIDSLKQRNEELERGKKSQSDQNDLFKYDNKRLQEENTKLKTDIEQLKTLQEENAQLMRNIEQLKKNDAADIPYHEVNLGDCIGVGGYGEVFKAQWHGQNIAVKRIKLSALVTARIESFLNESRTIMRLRHKHVVLPMGTIVNPNTKELMLVMEFMKHGSLEDLLFPEERAPVKLERHQVIQLALDVAKGLNYLHCLTPKIIHRDLKCANILLYRNKTRAKISDFGTARFLNKNSMAKTFQGTIGYLAPELWEEDDYNEKADVYSFGIVLLALAKNKDNLPTTRDPAKLRNRIKEMLDASISMSHDTEFRRLVHDCCQISPPERPSMKECIEVLKKLRQK